MYQLNPISSSLHTAVQSLINVLVYGEGGGSVNGVAVDIEVEIGLRSGVNGSAG
jgi:hypothetical protein